VLAGVDREQGEAAMLGVRRRDIDDVDLGVGDQLLVGAEGARDATATTR
jgi:hypothetical protein